MIRLPNYIERPPDDRPQKTDAVRCPPFRVGSNHGCLYPYSFNAAPTPNSRPSHGGLRSPKLPGLVDSFRSFVKDLGPLMVEDPPFELVEEAAKMVNSKDAPILAAAQRARADYLVTLDKKHFLKARHKLEFSPPVVTPEEFLRTLGF